MLREIRIRGLGVIDDAVLQLADGLNVVTGETGAGKTMVVSGLGLLLGERADAGRVRTGADQALVEGVVEVAADHPAVVRAVEAGADVDDALIMSRTVSASGRSRAHVGGRSAPVGLLGELGHHLVAVHGQADQWRLQQPEQHRLVLDSFAGEPVAVAAKQYRELYDALESARAELADLTTAQRERLLRLDSLTASLEEIEKVDPQPGEDTALAAEAERLANADALRGGGRTAHVALMGDEEDTDDAGPSVVDLVSHARAGLTTLTDHDPALAELDSRLRELGVLAADLGADLASYTADVDVEPGRLDEVNDRRAAITALLRKYGESVDEVLAWSKDAAKEAADLAGTDDRINMLQETVGDLEPRLGAAAAALSAARQDAARTLGTRVGEELAHLAMGSARVEVAVRQHEHDDGLLLPDGRQVRTAAHGVDDVEIMLAANKGAPPRTVAKAASGGELSRVMLALEVVTASGDLPTFVFDEVDAGVGGAAALDVGARLKALAEHAQVIVVTHLAQVAAYADQHLVVHKQDDGQVTSSGVTVVRGAEREAELARMLGGVSDSKAARRHARELLKSTQG
ncbi:DNA repair protein RecN [Luteipulveratus halotolerans]|uniref:DNA repair protein RecN n=1 Tax=Luteipulveratus halotolerans TaxID=1631356 RepID=A0A0L6CP86_9MICO|nr:DNA repair protein RecN [Luteipulveratus halotolerans]KNX39348.1 DNA recombination protein RecN [Luteipulveratus halotolerans]